MRNLAITLNRFISSGSNQSRSHIGPSWGYIYLYSFKALFPIIIIVIAIVAVIVKKAAWKTKSRNKWYKEWINQKRIKEQNQRINEWKKYNLNR